MQIVKYVFQQHGDERGQLVALEEHKDIPFEIKRVYYMYCLLYTSVVVLLNYVFSKLFIFRIKKEN